VRRRATPLQAKRVAALQLDGIAFRKESKRYYPNRELPAHLLGYVGVDNVGLAGLEATYDKTVRGREGKLLVQTDARRKVFSRLERSRPRALDRADHRRQPAAHRRARRCAPASRGARRRRAPP
jgi:cell division protein FtsI/penicillin-binding protein 2